MNGLTKLIRRRSFDLIMYGYVKGVLTNLPSVTIEQAIEQFMKIYGIPKDEYSVSTGMQTYTRMNHELMEFEKSQTRS